MPDLRSLAETVANPLTELFAGLPERIGPINLRAQFLRTLREADAWLMPTVAVRPPRLDALQSDEAFFATNGLVLRNPSVLNFLDGCAVSLPMPAAEQGIGLSVGGLNGRDARVLQVAGAIEAALR